MDSSSDNDDLDNSEDLGSHSEFDDSEVLTKGSLLKDIKQMSGAHATSSLEAFHSVQNHFATKRLAFSYHGMTSR